MEPVTDQTRNAVWRTLYDLERNVRYYHAMADLYRRRYLCLRFVILVGIFIEAVILYAAASQFWAFYVAAGGGLLLAALTVWDIVSNYAENAATLRITAYICDDLKTDTAELWRDVAACRISDLNAETTLRSITHRRATATRVCRRKPMTDCAEQPPPTPPNQYAAAMPSNRFAERRPGPIRPPEDPPPPPPPHPPPNRPPPLRTPGPEPPPGYLPPPPPPRPSRP